MQAAAGYAGIRTHAARPRGARNAAPPRLRAIAFALALASAASCRTEAPRQAQPPALGENFAPLVERLSEPGGYFDTDNLISNEASYLHALGPLRELGVSGGAYIGVGPDQNFSYIARIRPQIAFIIDIRRDNLLQHLWLKSLFQLAADRTDYLTLMFGRPRPPFEVPDGAAGLERLLDWIQATPADSARLRGASVAIHAALRRYGVPLTEEDTAKIDRIHRIFIDAGPALQFTSFNRAPRPYYPTYRRLLLETDLEGRPGSYLARDEDFAFVKRLEDGDRVVPVVGDLAGEHALTSIGKYLDAQHLGVSALYTSNVEFYLMREDGFDRFAATVARLPRTQNAVIIRSWFHPYRYTPPGATPGYASTQIVQPMANFVERARSGGYTSYRELVSGGRR